MFLRLRLCLLLCGLGIVSRYKDRGHNRHHTRSFRSHPLAPEVTTARTCGMNLSARSVTIMTVLVWTLGPHIEAHPTQLAMPSWVRACSVRRMHPDLHHGEILHLNSKKLRSQTGLASVQEKTKISSSS